MSFSRAPFQERTHHFCTLRVKNGPFWQVRDSARRGFLKAPEHGQFLTSVTEIEPLESRVAASIKKMNRDVAWIC